ncbi:unnamed protein product [Rotaria sp. Silwood1]|nr:unnamed protein product [Rotaria sp. Silwood1]CAF5038723.1 unnamed protein product [Rotaria sp. Silwood1]
MNQNFKKIFKEWRNEAHDTIDKFYKSKHDEYIRTAKEILHSLTSDHDASKDYLDWAKYVIQSIHQQLDEFEQVKLIFSRLKIGNYLINDPSRIFDLKFHSSPNYSWKHETCYDTTLFISTFSENPFIIEYTIFPSIHLNKRWPSLIICKENEVISDMKSNENNLRLIVNNDNNNESHLEVRSIKSFELIWSIYLGKGWSYRCSPLNDNHWIFVDSYNNRFIQISDHATIDQIINYPTKSFNVVSWGLNQFVIRTVEHLNIHNRK